MQYSLCVVLSFSLLIPWLLNPGAIPSFGRRPLIPCSYSKTNKTRWESVGLFGPGAVADYSFFYGELIESSRWKMEQRDGCELWIRQGWMVLGQTELWSKRENESLRGRWSMDSSWIGNGVRSRNAWVGQEEVKRSGAQHIVMYSGHGGKWGSCVILVIQHQRETYELWLLHN